MSEVRDDEKLDYFWKSFLDFLELKEKDADGYKNYFNIQQIEKNLHDQIGVELPLDLVYMYQDYMASSSVLRYANLFRQTTQRIPNLLDIGSRFETALYFSHVANVTYLEPREATLPLDDGSGGRKTLKHIPAFGILKGEGQDIPADDESYELVVSLHALEHFGLGRYGDTIDYYGDQKALKEYYRVLKKNGKLLLSIPCGFENVIRFNKERIYHPSVIDEMVNDAGFNLEKGIVICPHRVSNPEISDKREWNGVYFDHSLLDWFKETYEKDNSYVFPNAAYFVIASKK
jgi:SAM-dependent methyltransferase